MSVQDTNIRKREVSLAAFDHPDVGAVKAGEFGELFLREAAGGSQGSDAFAEFVDERLIQHSANYTDCMQDDLHTESSSLEWEVLGILETPGEPERPGKPGKLTSSDLIWRTPDGIQVTLTESNSQKSAGDIRLITKSGNEAGDNADVDRPEESDDVEVGIRQFYPWIALKKRATGGQKRVSKYALCNRGWIWAPESAQLDPLVCNSPAVSE